MRRRDAAFVSAVARWLDAQPRGERLATLAGGPVRIRLVGVGRDGPRDPHAALAEVRVRGVSITLAGSSRGTRALAQKLLGGPAELAAPRPLSAVEQAIWTLAVATALVDAGVDGEVFVGAGPPPREAVAIELAVELAGQAMTVVASVPRELELRAPMRALPAWTFALPIIVARCALAQADLGRLAVRDVIVVERELSLAIGDAVVGLTAAPQAVAATVATGYVRRDMALPDDVHLELTVQLGTTRLSLHQISELAVGQVVALGRPLAGPYEIRAGGRLVGQGELVDVDGELGVRILALSSD